MITVAHPRVEGGALRLIRKHWYPAPVGADGGYQPDQRRQAAVSSVQLCPILTRIPTLTLLNLLTSIWRLPSATGAVINVKNEPPALLGKYAFITEGYGETWATKDAKQKAFLSIFIWKKEKV